MTSRLRTSDEFDPLHRRLAELAPLFQDHADECDRRGGLTDEVVRALHGSGVFRIGIPRELGGYEFSPRQQLATIAQLSYWDASVAWTTMALQMVTGTTAAYLGPEAAREPYPDVARGEHALMAGQSTKPGTAVRVDGGHRISGHWQFASGIALADHLHSAARCAETGRVPVFTFPKKQATLIDNWDVLGLRATDSIDYTCEDVFGPDTHVFEATTTRAHHGGAPGAR
ncbi:hypothetical protein GCM10011581_26150 [Saccharopolyspora subtropica]|uniref:Acyl-CoA dehydrogenase/oxidase N-terminal domain-containing protein n=1 Tax=Saccharopolyspora thermophila TaxID=89367 RepID=A0A917JXM4_9PSEU|nr:acyl-CoA dehydrogenase family protein [Saccharopolyspora subtropica]GGI87843.1 hypothetical protein GCM10011581_26150 [Saccharopolyspora subtropica]